MNESLSFTLKTLRLSGLAETLDVRLQEAGGNHLTHAEFLELILQDELLVRKERQIARRVKSAAFRELKSLEEFDWSFNPAIKKSDELEKQKALLARKINLIMELKSKQDVPVHILDQISKNLPEFLWLSSMSANNNQISLAGRATTYNAVSNFYKNLTSSGYFDNVTLGRTFEEQAGVTFSLSASFTRAAAETPPAENQG